jgi:TPR repeat protein
LDFISIAAAITLTEWSDSTFRRRVADGSLTRSVESGGSGRVMVDFASIRPHACIPLQQEDIELVAGADAGRADAQNDLALLFLEHGKPRSAIYWLELAAKQGSAEAMHWLGRCYLDGNGMLQDQNLGIMWLAKAAAEGHPISRAQMDAMRARFCAA